MQKVYSGSIRRLQFILNFAAQQMRGHEGACTSGLEDGLIKLFCIQIFVEFVFIVAADIGLN